jgi:ureidoglycolate amidohydrolase
MNARVDEQRLMRELETLATFSDVPEPAVTRIVFTETDMRARAFIKGLCTEAGFAVREDAVGNTFARWEGADPGLPPVATGSHIDAIPNAGRYDGTVGVLGGLEAMRSLARGGVRPRRSLELIIFTSEEPTRFGIGCLGSRLLAGTLDASADERLTDSGGRTLRQVRAQAGLAAPLSSVRLARGAYRAFIELHIEQGPLLERRSVPIGVVTAIAAPASIRIWIEGEGGHAGAVLMKDRHDAFLAGAEIALAVEASARFTSSEDTVGTVGVCDVFPGAVNSVPSRVRLDVDVRDTDATRRDAVLDLIARACDEVGHRRGVTVRIDPINADAPAHCSREVVNALLRACDGRGFRHDRMISRAYHDSLFMSGVAPTAMLFIPCRDGVSHRPDEYASPAAIANGVAVLADTLAELSAG